MQLAPPPLLAGCIRSVWLNMPGQAVTTPGHEHILPTGEMHLVFRLSGPAISILDGPHALIGADLGHAVVGGARASFYTKDASSACAAIGVQLLPGAAQLLLGLPANELAGRHVRLDDLWGRNAALMHEQLVAAPSPAAKLHLLQALLLARLRPGAAPAVHPAVIAALAAFKTGASVQQAVACSAYSHRQFIRLFAQAVGLPPKLYLRVRRFQQALGLMQRGVTRQPLSEVASVAGYSDQAHFNRDFREFSGLTPEQYRHAPVLWPNHVPVPHGTHAAR